jgi:hypothetical protein
MPGEQRRTKSDCKWKSTGLEPHPRVLLVVKRWDMRLLFKNFASLLLAAAVISPVMMTGCRSQETVYYNRWEQDTHREHRDLNQRTEAEKQEYSEWRRSHH